MYWKHRSINPVHVVLKRPQKNNIITSVSETWQNKKSSANKKPRHVSRFLYQWRCVASMHVFPRWDFKVSSVVPGLILLPPSNTRFQLKREEGTIKYLPKISPLLAPLCTRVPPSGGSVCLFSVAPIKNPVSASKCSLKGGKPYSHLECKNHPATSNDSRTAPSGGVGTGDQVTSSDIKVGVKMLVTSAGR